MHTIDATPIHRKELGNDIVYSASYVTKTSDGVIYDISKQTNGGAHHHHTIIFETEREFQVFKGYPKLFWDTAEEEAKGNYIKVIRVISERGNNKNTRYNLMGIPDVTIYEKFGMYHVINFQYDSKYEMFDVIVPVEILTCTLSRETIKRINKCIDLFINITMTAGKGYIDEKGKKFDFELKLEKLGLLKTETKSQKGRSCNEKDKRSERNGI